MKSSLAFAIALAAIIGGQVPSRAETSAVEIHYAPSENLESIDVALIHSASHTIDMAAYILNDYAVIDALREAAARGVTIRIYRNHDEEGRYPQSEPYKALASTPGVTIRVKHAWPLMHLKSYVIDGALLRTGSANFSPSGEKKQDNDLLVIRDVEAAARFEADFARIWGEGEALR